jgi:hypothetical protein
MTLVNEAYILLNDNNTLLHSPIVRLLLKRIGAYLDSGVYTVTMKQPLLLGKKS